MSIENRKNIRSKQESINHQGKEEDIVPELEHLQEEFESLKREYKSQSTLTEFDDIQSSLFGYEGGDEEGNGPPEQE